MRVDSVNTDGCLAGVFVLEYIPPKSEVKGVHKWSVLFFIKHLSQVSINLPPMVNESESSDDKHISLC